MHHTTRSFQEIEDMVMNQQTEESHPEVFYCIECNAERDAENLFVLDMRDLAKIKGEEEGKEKSIITPEDLPDFAVCAKCRDPEEQYTLASAIASCQRYHQRRSWKQRQAISMARSRMIVTDVEAKELVSCFSCEELGKETKIPRQEAQAPGWVGCNILKGRRLQNSQNPNQKALVYVTSKDLLKSGQEGFVACPKCMNVVIPDLQKTARDLGLPEDIIMERIWPRSLIAMIKGVRRKEERDSRSIL